MTEPTFKVVVRDPEQETTTYCNPLRMQNIVALAEELGFEVWVSEVEESECSRNFKPIEVALKDDHY